jgi:hypothetical protein
VRLIPDGVRPVPGEAGSGEVPLVDIAISNDSQSIAGIDPDGSVWEARMLEGAPLIRIREAGQPTSVAFDQSSVWVVDAKDGLQSVSSDGTSEAIAVSGLSKRTGLIAAIPSRDGARAALIVRRGPRTGLLLARVIRTAGSTTRIAVNAPIRIESRLVEVLDAAWSSADTLSVLGSESAGTVQVFDVSIARGTSTSRGTPQAPISVAAAPGLPTLVGAADGLVYEFTAGAWAERVRGSSPAYPD